MREAEFRAWLEAQDYEEATVIMQINRVRRIEQSYGDLDALVENAGLEKLQQQLAYSKADERAQNPNPAKFQIDGNIYNNMATYRKTLDYYRQFSAGGGVQQADGQNITDDAIEAAMDEFDAIGLEGFKSQYGFGTPQKYWVRRPSNGKLYPAKAIVGVSHGHIPGGVPLKASDFYGGQGEQAANGILRKLGYEIVTRGLTTPDRIELNAPDESNAVTMPTNLILYGPPGTGKTYNTALEAVALCDGEADYASTRQGRAALMARYNELQRKGRIGFVTFHQNFSYEDFVEGLRPQQAEADEEGGPGTGFSLVPRDGVFKQISKVAAENKGQAVTTDLPPMDGSRKIFKMSLGRSWSSEDDAIFENALVGKYVVLGWGGNVDWSDPKYDDWEEIKKRWRQDHPDASGNDPNMSQMYTFRANMEIGSIIVISDGNMKFRAIAEITSPYQYQPGPGGEYNHRRSVRWLWHSTESLPRERIYRKSLSQVSAYQMRSASVEWEALGQIISSSGDAVATSGEPESYVLIIDEINRANVSKVFGELITLIEPDKRAGMDNALSVKLPYSGETFSVPTNLHIIGTMNTADRSIALLDTALRRRFNFREMAPEPGLLADASKRTGIDLVRVLTTINQRVEYLIDREHRIGHAFFIACETAQQVHAAMRDKVIPLLQEYFFEDWSRIHAVLGDGFIREDKLDPPPGIEGDRVSSWSVLAPFKSDAFERLTGKVANTAEKPGE